ncbi:uncharacterized protein DDB_G0271670 [Leptopilina heterotoma]|uniref:uncharacterized protein DDB_G0271670 n=1 Tax=Leptopilina heterotoma TaxID=63436 RepID=UPI001CA9524C|nr:uncharacterized protein DDB_G0271670 [Leptopilina heterotoma]
MANGISFGRTASSSVLILLVLMQAVLFWKPTIMAPSPAKRSNDVIAGTEFLSVFINGAMAPRPVQRRRGNFRRTGHHHTDSISSESKHNEAFIYRISRAPPAARTTVILPKASTSSPYRDSDVRYYPISQKALNHSHSLVSLIDDLATVDEITSKLRAREGKHGRNTTMISKTHKIGKGDNKILDRKVIGVSVTSSVEATPYKIRIEHHQSGNSVKLRVPSTSSTTPGSTSSSISSSSTSTEVVTPPSTRLVTEDLGNIVSESNRSEFSVDEGSAQTVWQEPSVITSKPYPTNEKSISSSEENSDTDSATSGSSSISVEYHIAQENSYSPKQVAELIGGSRAHYQGRKVSRHYDGSFYENNSQRRHHNDPIDTLGKSYSEPEKIYSEPAKVYSEPAKVYSEPSKIYGEPSKVYSEPARIYSEPEKVYSEPARIYSEPAKVYSEPAKVYSEPSKIYDSNGQPTVNSQSVEPVEQNYEVDEAVSVGSNGNVHGPQPVTVATNNKADPEDGRKVGYVVEGRNYRKYRVEERTPDGFIVGEYGVVSHDDGSLRGVRYTADGTINPRLIYDALMKFLAL